MLEVLAQATPDGFISSLVTSAPHLAAVVGVVWLFLVRLRDMDETRTKEQALFLETCKQINKENNEVYERITNKADQTFTSVARSLDVNSQTIAINSEVMRRMGIDQQSDEPGRHTVRGPSGIMSGG